MPNTSHALVGPVRGALQTWDRAQIEGYRQSLIRWMGDYSSSNSLSEDQGEELLLIIDTYVELTYGDD